MERGEEETYGSAARTSLRPAVHKTLIVGEVAREPPVHRAERHVQHVLIALVLRIRRADIRSREVVCGTSSACNSQNSNGTH